MDAQEQEYNSCLLNMPVIVLDKILSNIHNRSNVSRTCKYLYEFVCGMERHRHVMYIRSSDAKSFLNIESNAVFDSIMDTHREIKEMELRLDYAVGASYKLNEQQMERITSIMKEIGANITSFSSHRFVLPINFILQLLQQAPNLESLSFTRGKVMDSVTKNVSTSLQLPSLKALEIDNFPGISDVVDLITAPSLKSIRYIDHSINATGVLKNILTKHQHIKSLTLEVRTIADLTALCIDHLQLETLVFKSRVFNHNIQYMEFLNGQTNLKELRFINCYLSGSVFQWICNNMKKLEVFEVDQVYLIERNAFPMLVELKQLRHFRTSDADYLFDNGFHSVQFKSDSIEKLEIGFEEKFTCGELLNKMVNSMAHNLPNLTHLKMRFKNFSALCFVLAHCTQIIHLKSRISDLIPDQLSIQQRFPNIQHLELCNYFYGEMMSESVTSLVRAMPNLKSMSLSTIRVKCDVNTLKGFIKEIKSLEYLYVDLFELNGELSTGDVVQTIQCLMDQLKGYRIIFSPATSPEDLNWHKIKDILSNVFYVRDDYWLPPSFYLQKGEQKKCRSES